MLDFSSSQSYWNVVQLTSLFGIRAFTRGPKPAKMPESTAKDLILWFIGMLVRCVTWFSRDRFWYVVAMNLQNIQTIDKAEWFRMNIRYIWKKQGSFALIAYIQIYSCIRCVTYALRIRRKWFVSPHCNAVATLNFGKWRLTFFGTKKVLF